MENISLIGGDSRNAELAKLLIREGKNVKVYGIEDDSLKNEKTLEEAVLDSQVIVLGIPALKDKEMLKADIPISTTYFLNCIKESQIVFGGVLKDKLLTGMQKKGVKYVDFMQSEEFAILNTIPTVEGAIEIAISETDITLHGANILILGFGRIGKLLAKTLKGFECKIDLAARKDEDFAWIDTYAYRKVTYDNIDEKLDEYDIIFNTVTVLLLDERRLEKMKKDCLIIDLASKPGGVDFEKANLLGLKTNWALGLPGKVAPKAAAKYMKRIIEKN
jgi:dipicolinate synthase subunit A